MCYEENRSIPYTLRRSETVDLNHQRLFHAREFIHFAAPTRFWRRVSRKWHVLGVGARSFAAEPRRRDICERARIKRAGGISTKNVVKIGAEKCSSIERRKLFEERRPDERQDDGGADDLGPSRPATR
jgi:hypothetical protein